MSGEGIASVSMGENVPELMEEGNIEQICLYSNPEDSKVYPIPLDSLHEECSAIREHLKENTRILKPLTRQNMHYASFQNYET